MRRLFIAIAGIAIITGCQTKTSASLHIDPTLESLVPADTIAIAGANLEALRATTLYEKIQAQAPFNPLDTFARQTGLDPRKDLSQVLACSDGKNSFFVGRGKFKKADLEARLESKSGGRITYNNQRLFGTEQAAVVILDDSTIIAGATPQLKAAIDRKSGGLPSTLADLLRTLPADDQIYAALVGGMQRSLGFMLPQKGDLGNLRQVLVAVDTAVAGINLTGGVHLTARMKSNTERDAKFVHDMLKGLIGFERLSTPENQYALLKVYDAIQVTQEQMETEVKAGIPSQEANRLVDFLFKR